jgi:pimeloyl-ACP methyl ester carboxylesterase
LLLLAALSGRATAACLASVAAGSGCLEEVDATVSVANRFPLILVHGWNSDSVPGPPSPETWNNFISYYNSAAGVDLKARYKLYRFLYVSNVVDLAALGGALRDVLDMASAADPQNFGTKRFAIVAHSMGGLVARNFMGLQQLQGPFAGQKGGERVLKLITLGTPHHGSPAANGPARDAKAGPNWSGTLQFIDQRFPVAYNQVNRSDLWWTNYPGGFQLDYQTYPNEQNLLLMAMNGDPTYDRRIIAYAGAISGGTACFTNDSDCLYHWGSVVMNGAFGLPNDGIVPVVSAYFETHDITRRPLFSGYNHGQLARGKSASDTTVFDQLRSDLLIQPAAHDFDFDSRSDIAWRQTGGATALWLMSGVQVLQSGSFGVVPVNWQIVGQSDFDGDGRQDWLWRDGTTGTVAIWLLNGLQISQSGALGTVPGNWTISGAADVSGDGKGDIVWRDGTTGTVAVWLLDGLQVSQSASLGAVPTSWVIAGTADFNGDGKADILWRDSNTGAVAVWLLNGSMVLGSGGLGTVAGNWTIAGTGDFNGDGKSDIVWRDTGTGAVAIWLLNGLSVSSSGGLGAVPGNWVIAETGDFDGDGKADILWRDTTAGTVAIWFMNGLQVSSSAAVATVDTSFVVQGLNAD